MKEQLVSQCSASLSAVLLTVPLEKPVENEEKILYYMKCLFGPEVQKYFMILFTHEDDLENLDEPQTIDEYLQNHADLQRLVTECGGKIHCFNNRSKSDDQKQELLQKIVGMVVKNGGKFIIEQMKRRSSKDDPGVDYLLDPKLNKEQLEKMKEQLVSQCSAGLSAVLLTVSLEEPVENEEEILYYTECLFGPEVQKYIMFLFTHEDALDETIDEHLQNEDNVDLQ
ncbi:GTPase IMAP family member 8-like protein [Labeo rohita]|uniref:GTPase IMAP family member 8-like protein n=1 Tax=Labeo rohita TaxID=84645 RepID=A0A498MWU3_LABRO|nr:GTPase IMAP family member 8-like protein [Labeo rohita]